MIIHIAIIILNILINYSRHINLYYLFAFNNPYSNPYKYSILTKNKYSDF